MEACVIICRSSKPKARKGRILFIDAVAEIASERAQRFLKSEHQRRILDAYRSFRDEPGFAAVASIEEIIGNDGNMAIARYVTMRKSKTKTAPTGTVVSAWTSFEEDGREFWPRFDVLTDMLNGVVAEEAKDA